VVLCIINNRHKLTKEQEQHLFVILADTTEQSINQSINQSMLTHAKQSYKKHTEALEHI